MFPIGKFDIVVLRNFGRGWDSIQRKTIMGTGRDNCMYNGWNNIDTRQTGCAWFFINGGANSVTDDITGVIYVCVR